MPDDVLGIFSGSFQSFGAVIVDGDLASARHIAVVYWHRNCMFLAYFITFLSECRLSLLHGIV
jgi:hypothetical protein